MAWAADTNLLRGPSTRRLLTTIAYRRQSPLLLLPTVRAETVDVVARRQRQAWRRTFREHRVSESVRRAVETSTDTAVARWLAAEIERGEGHIQGANQTSEDVDAVEELADGIPRSCFSVARDRDIPKDAYILAEAVHHGVTLLSTRNMNSMLHFAVNEWASQWRSEPLLLTPDASLERVLQGENEPDKVYRHVLEASLSDGDSSPEQVHRQFLNLQRALAGTDGFSETAELALIGRQNDPDFEAHVAALQREAPSLPPAQMEQRLGHALRQAARETGWDR